MYSYHEPDALIKSLEATIEKPASFQKGGKIFTGVDLGTAYTVLVVLDEDKRPIACKMQFANVIRDGLVVDFAGASHIVRRLKRELEETLGIELMNTAIAVPPGTASKTCETHRYVAESAGFEVTNILDEPTAANGVLGLTNGVIVDIGGGTTGLSILKDGKVLYTADEPTGGTHVTLVLSGHYKISFEEAEQLKKDKSRHKEILPVVVPVYQKMGSIIRNHIQGYDVDHVYLVGGTCCMEGVEKVIEREVGIPTSKPYNPLLVTPLGIALNCK